MKNNQRCRRRISQRWQREVEVVLLLFAGLTFYYSLSYWWKSNPVDIAYFPSSHRTYHRCVLGQIPYITHPLETAQYLLYNNKSFIRFGDSEILLIRGGSEPFQRYDEALAQSLSRAFKDPSDSLMVGLYDCFSGFPLWGTNFTNWWLTAQYEYRRWVLDNYSPSRQYFSAMITSTYVHTYGTFCALLPKLYGTLREIWRLKDVIILRGDNKQTYQFDVFDTAASQTIYFAPRYQAWSEYRSLKNLLLNEDPSKLFILSAGPVARVLAYDLMKEGRRALDLGHLAKDYNLYMLRQKPVDEVFFERNENPDVENAILQDKDL